MLNTIKNAILAIGYGVGLALFANDATIQRIKQENAERRKAKHQLPPKNKTPRWASMGTIRRFEVDYSTLGAVSLRKECQKNGIEWRSVHGKNKHLRKQEMIELLTTIRLQNADVWASDSYCILP